MMTPGSASQALRVELDCTNCEAHFTAKTDADGNYSFEAAAETMFVSLYGTPPSCPGITPFKRLAPAAFLITCAVVAGWWNRQ
jgi:hypothetical protein